MQFSNNHPFKKWLEQNGCFIHKDLQIPSFLNGVQGVSTKNPIPHKTLVMAIPTKIILTVSKCYNHPILHKLYKANEDLFDFQSSEDGEFNILCVFLMYSRFNLQDSEWKAYLEIICKPETVVDWNNEQLEGLNQSLLEEIIHVQKQCKILQDQIIAYLMTTQPFSHIPQKELRFQFNSCYRTVMTRCFGYYFGEVSLIPGVDLINHGCQSLDHQLLHLGYQKQTQFYEGYQNRHNKINCQLLGLQKPKIDLKLPPRQKYLVQHGLVGKTLEQQCELNRQKIDKCLYHYYKQKIKKEKLQINEINFCSENDEQDNDTDQQVQTQKQKQFKRLNQQQKQQMQQFRKNFVKIQTISQIEQKIKTQYKELSENKINKKQQNFHKQSQKQLIEQINKQKEQKIEIIDKKQEQKLTSGDSIETAKQLVPIELLCSSDEEQNSSEEQQWCMQDQAYFTIATDSAIASNKQIYNSYGSRTNKFLLVWYGFAYRNNLYDSVTLRLHVQFLPELKNAADLILDTYVGGKGLAFRKKDQSLVQITEISQQFRLKRGHLCNNLIVFLRLYLLNYYKGKDLYKIFVTFPSSLQYQLFVLNYYREIIIVLYDRYPQQTIQKFKQQCKLQSDCNKINRMKNKIIYLEQQRAILDCNFLTVNSCIKIISCCLMKCCTEFSFEIYKDIDIITLRKIKPYLNEIKNNYQYIIYKQPYEKK